MSGEREDLIHCKTLSASNDGVTGYTILSADTNPDESMRRVSFISTESSVTAEVSPAGMSALRFMAGDDVLRVPDRVHAWRTRIIIASGIRCFITVNIKKNTPAQNPLAGVSDSVMLGLRN